MASQFPGAGLFQNLWTGRRKAYQSTQPKPVVAQALKSIEYLEGDAQEPAGETPASPGPDSPRGQEPSQLEELADFMEQVGHFSCLFSPQFFPHQTVF